MIVVNNVQTKKPEAYHLWFFSLLFIFLDIHGRTETGIGGDGVKDKIHELKGSCEDFNRRSGCHEQKEEYFQEGHAFLAGNEARVEN